MSPRLLALLLVASAAILHFGVAVPAAQDAEATRADNRRLASSQSDARMRLVSLERREAARQRAAGIVAGAGTTQADPLGLLRRSTLASLEGARVSGVRLEVRPARAPVGGSLHLSAEGSATEILRLCGHLVRPGSGLVLDKVRLTPSHAGLMLDLEAFSLGGRS